MAGEIGAQVEALRERRRVLERGKARRDASECARAPPLQAVAKAQAAASVRNEALRTDASNLVRKLHDSRARAERADEDLAIERMREAFLQRASLFQRQRNLSHPPESRATALAACAAERIRAEPHQDGFVRCDDTHQGAKSSDEAVPVTM